MNKINLPQIVSIGAQSCGKSSVLEMIIGKDILPRGTGIVTRRPTIIQLFKINSNSKEYAVFSHNKEEKIFDFSQITIEIMRQMEVGAGKNRAISPVPIVLKIYSPRVVNLSLIDLPGITKIPVGNQPKDIEKIVKTMISKYIKNPNSLILAISPANQDLANSDSLKMARTYDPEGIRTLGVITKMDKCDDDEVIIQILNKEVYHLSMGYVGVKCRSQEEIQQGISMFEALKIERAFFKNHPIFKIHKDKLGIPYLTKRLSEYLIVHIQKSIPLIRQKLDSIVYKKQEERNRYGIIFDFSESESSKGALLISIINKYTRYYVDTLKGDLCLNSELCGGAKIVSLFEEFKSELYAMSPFEGISEKQIALSVRNVCGLSQSLIISDKAFEVLVKKELERFKEPVFKCLSKVFHQLKAISSKIIIPELEVMEDARSAILNVVYDILARCFKPAQQMLTSIFKIEIGFINTRHPQFVRQRELLMNHRLRESITAQKAKRNQNNGKGETIKEKFESDRKSELTLIIQLIAVYFDIVKNNLIDYIPKAVITLLVYESCEICERELVSRLYSDENIEKLLSKNSSLMKKQMEIEKELEMLRECQMILDKFEASHNHL